MHASAGFRESNYGGDSDMKQYVTSRWMGALALALVIAPGLLAQDAKLSIVTVASTVPSNGDVNPYGVAVVPASIGKLVQGHILVSNFNSSANLQGTGSGLRIASANLFLPYLRRVARFVLYQQHSVIRGDSPHRKRSFFSLLGDESIAVTSR